MKTDVQAFFEKVNQTSECWLWTGTLTSRGYGRFHIHGKRFRAHRWSYERFVNKIEEGLTIDHLCKNKSCVKPQHLEAVTNSVNISRYWANDSSITESRDWKTGTCTNGHDLSIVGYVDRKKKNGSISRECIQCRRNQHRRHYEKKHAKVLV